MSKPPTLAFLAASQAAHAQAIHDAVIEAIAYPDRAGAAHARIERRAAKMVEAFGEWRAAQVAKASVDA